jgi:hypothetical protein
MPQHMNVQHRGQRVGRTGALLARSGIVRLDQIDESLARHHNLNLRQERLALGAFHKRGQLLVSETKLVAAHHASTNMRLQSHFREE